MDTIGIDTAQNVSIEYEIASIGERFVAYLLDSLIVFAYVVIMIFIWIFGVALLSSIASPPLAIIIILVIISVLPYMFYHLLCEIFMNGQSFGKQAQNIKVLKVDGSPPGFMNYLLRWILRPIDSIYGLGLVVILINGKGQRLGDLAAGTTVVRTQLRTSLRETLYAKVEEAYQPMFPEATRLSDEQVRLIREALNQNLLSPNAMLMLKMSQKTKSIMQINSDLPDVKFLYTVLKDYNYYTQK